MHRVFWMVAGVSAATLCCALYERLWQSAGWLSVQLVIAVMAALFGERNDRRVHAFEAECLACAMKDCPGSDPLHYHHDGCPWCETHRGERGAF